MAPYGESPDSGRNPENPNRPETPLAASEAQPLSRREWREREARAAEAAAGRVEDVATETTAGTGKELALVAPVIAEAPPAAKALEIVVPASAPARRLPAVRMPRFKKPTKKGAVSAVVMTFAAGLIATMALPAYAFGGGGNFDSTVATETSLSGAQTLEVPDASAALAVSRDNYKAPTSEELAAAREAAAAAVAATEAANAAASAAAAKSATATSGAFTVNPPSGSYSGAAVVAFAEQFVGVVPYGSGASPDTSFGCDGLTQYVFGAFGIYLPRTVSNQAAMGIPIAPEDAQAGDLMIYPIGHVGIYDGNGGMIDSPDWGRYVEHRPVWGSYYFVRIV
ncbi:C40 family peptidase [Herbiconiux daphne]|uniref:NlpC/P60 family protein n=1 Tax=Herbiconiux daphne TaxID=2970914 RepID=A0ABT2GXQ9_9MICO|nr:NlpC/P60 family protein [Herbiconiux daphne]MCS5732737.1 NlpC/P60 family protein [Herbiconiux daphne]